MAKIVYLFAFVAFIQVASALQCYSCDKTTCQEEKSKWAKNAECGKPAVANNVVACLKQVYTDKTTNKEVSVRRCVFADKKADDPVSFKCNDNEGKTSVCEVCTDDLCNSAPSINFGFVTVLGVIVASLIPKLM